MKNRNWTLDELKKELTRSKDIKGWVITLEHTHRRERYFMKDSDALTVDQDRDVKGQSVVARIFVHLDREGRQGEITKKLFPSLALGPQLDSAIEAAKQTDHQAWELPARISERLPELATTDPRIAEDMEGVMGELTHEISKIVSRKGKSEFNSAELFVSLHDHELHLSNGLVHRSSQSRIYAESAWSFSRKDATGKIDADEYMSTRWSVNSKDLQLTELFQESAERATHMLDVKKPATGKYSVIVDSEVLSTLFNGQLAQLSGMNAYNRLPFRKPGDPLIPEATGDLITLTLDPHLDFGADTTAISDLGVAQKPLKVVEKNRIEATLADAQYAQYLGLSPTSVRGSVVIEPGELSHEELTQQAPLVLEILQFSGLFADPNSGTFSSEIRLARLYDNVKGTVSYLKGGSLSGSVVENFRGARFSRERIKRAHFEGGHGQGYFGPTHALLTEVSIAG